MNASMRHAAVYGVLALCALCVAAPTATLPNPPHAFARGWANLLGGWLEIPRGVIYENTRIPVVGFAAGPVKGTFLALWRELAGGMDVLCFGVTRQGLYTRDVPEFVWDATWIPTCAGADVCDDVQPPRRRAVRRHPAPPAACEPDCMTTPPETEPTIAPRAVRRPPAPSEAEPTPAPRAIRRPSAPPEAEPTPAPRAVRRQPLPPEAASCNPRPSRPATDSGSPFSISADKELDARIAAMEERVQEMERKAAIFK